MIRDSNIRHHHAFRVAALVLSILFGFSDAIAQPTTTTAAAQSTAPNATTSKTDSNIREASASVPTINVASPNAASLNTAPPMRDGERLPFMQQAENTAARAADSSSSSSGGDAPSGSVLLLKSFGAMLLIVGLIVAVGWGLRRFGGTQFGKAAIDAPELSILSSVALGNARSLAVVRFGERTLLVGSTANAISLLATDTPNETEVNQKFVAGSPAPRSVAEMLKADAPSDFSRELARANQGLRASFYDSNARVSWRDNDDDEDNEASEGGRRA